MDTKPLGLAKGLFSFLRMIRTRYFAAAAAVLAAALLAAIYWPGLHGNFFFDDGPSITLADGVRLETLSSESLRQALASGGAGPSGRPVAQLSFALNHYFSGFNPFAFKATNLAIHFACGLLVLALSRRLLGTARPLAQQRNLLIASGAVTALWLLHPIQLLPVLHAVQRMTSLSAFFLLAALLLHIRGRESAGRVAAAWLLLAWTVFWPLSCLSKESGLLFPVFVLAWELLVRRNSVGHLDRFARGLMALTALLLAAGLAYALSARAQWLWAGYQLRPFSLTERLLTESRVLWFYLDLIVAPNLKAFGLYHDDFVVSTGLLTPWTTLPALLGLAGLALLAWWTRRRAPLVALGILWFLIGHALESTVLPLELVHEHRNYLPVLGILMVAGWALTLALERQGTHRRIGVMLAAAALGYSLLVTALRSHQFGEEVRRTQVEARNHPSSARAQHEAGVSLAGLPEAALRDSPTYALARTHYETAGKLDPNLKMSWLGLIHLSCQAGMPAKQADVDELARRLRQTPFAPGDTGVLYNLKEMSIAGSICLTRVETDAVFAAALANPGVSPGIQAMLHSWHADYLWLRERDLAAARRALSQSLALNPSNPSNRLKWAQLLMLSGEMAQARQLLESLRTGYFPAEERKTLDELLAALNMTAR
ncbi:tetratricopeptide repeat protein [Polaromonas sp. CF318]|uniref:tetratricopeptide repeat protein n=1 Tax=Polaromonas sp. CF318 TaxID=1144318 RepID=UPI0002E65D3E|nr:tetratricopeptide repeat protein [Polaromonas sp. CF318]